MASTFWLNVVASDKVFYGGMCKQLIIPTLDGEKGILAHHEATMIAVKVGEAKFLKEDDTWVTVMVGTGFAQMINNRATLLVETAESHEEITNRRANEAMEHAKEQQRQKSSIQQHYQNHALLARATKELKKTKRHS